jgi:hypothetical protein
MVKGLRKIVISESEYFIDWRLLQLRNVCNPHDFKQFSAPLDMEVFLEEAELKNIKEPVKLVKVICSCIIGEKDCPYCKGSGVSAVKVIGNPYQEE